MHTHIMSNHYGGTLVDKFIIILNRVSISYNKGHSSSATLDYIYKGIQDVNEILVKHLAALASRLGPVHVIMHYV